MEQFDMFVTVVQQQSLNKASQLLNISQPALSRKIMKLEQELGVELFRRKGKRLELTRAGEVCYEYALDQQRLERKLHDSLRAFRSATKPASIVIGASLTTLQSTLPDLITIYTREHPHTDIKAVTGKTHEVVPLVKEKKKSTSVLSPRKSTTPASSASRCSTIISVWCSPPHTLMPITPA